MEDMENYGYTLFRTIPEKFIQNVKEEVKKAGLKDTEFIIIQY